MKVKCRLACVLIASVGTKAIDMTQTTAYGACATTPLTCTELYAPKRAPVRTARFQPLAVARRRSRAAGRSAGPPANAVRDTRSVSHVLPAIHPCDCVDRILASLALTGSIPSELGVFPMLTNLYAGRRVCSRHRQVHLSPKPSAYAPHCGTITACLSHCSRMWLKHVIHVL